MEAQEDSCDSLPYIDDSTADEDTTPQQYNLKISENYQNKNRNIEISNRSPKDIAKYFGPVVPPGESNVDTETRRNQPSSGMKLVIKGWNSSISIQGLDNKSSITFRRRCEKVHRKESGGEEKERVSKGNVEESKPRRGRWKTLTKSLMLARSTRFERRGLDERYPKYVLLKNEEEEITETKESYPKMFVFNDGKQKKNSAFNLRKSFKNKTEPIVPLDEILTKTENDRKLNETIKSAKQQLTQKCRREKRNVVIKKRVLVERRKSLKPEVQTGSAEFPLPQGFVCNEIQGIFEDTLKLLPQNLEKQQPDAGLEAHKGVENYASVPHPCQYSCHDPYCCLTASNQPPKYVSVYTPPKCLYQNPSQQTCQNVTEDDVVGEDFDNLSFGILSGFFPRVVIMKSAPGGDVEGEDMKERNVITNYGSDQTESKDAEPPKEIEVKLSKVLQIPQQDLTLKSKLVQQAVKHEGEDSILSDVSLKESSDEELKTKTQESEPATEYLQYSEFPEELENESVDRRSKPGTPPANSEYENKPETPLSLTETHQTQNGDDNPENLTLTKIGYKMYENLTKLSLNREKDTKGAEVSGCGCNGNETKKSPYNITLQSNNSVLQVTVPENKFNFKMVDSRGADIHIGVEGGGRGSGRKEEEEEEEGKIVVRKEELWHCDGGGRAVVLQNEGMREGAFQKVKVSLGDNKDVILSIEMNERDKKEEEKKEKTKERPTKEMKVGTDDFNLAGGDFASSGGSRNLSPRIGRLLKHLHEKLESDERERKFLDEKINRKLLHEEGVLPGVFLVKHISPRNQIARKPEVSLFEKSKKLPERQEKTGQVREYYCEECLATMRMFEDENPSVKSMVDKFETIIQLESY